MKNSITWMKERIFYKMNKDIFKQNNNIVLAHLKILKINWKIILFFLFFGLLITIALLSRTLVSPMKGFNIVPTIANYSTNHQIGILTYGGEITSVSKLLKWHYSKALELFSLVSLLFF